MLTLLALALVPRAVVMAVPVDNANRTEHMDVQPPGGASGGPAGAPGAQPAPPSGVDASGASAPPADAYEDAPAFAFEPVDVGCSEPQLTFYVQKLLGGRMDEEDARLAVEHFVRESGVPSAAVKAALITVSVRDWKPALGYMVCPTPEVTAVVLPPDSESRNGFFTCGTGRYRICLALAGSPAETAMLMGGDGAAGGAPPPAVSRHATMVHQLALSAIPPQGSESERALEACRQILQQSMRLVHHDPTLEIPECPGWATSRGGRSVSRCSLLYVVYSAKPLVPNGSYWFGHATHGATSAGALKKARTEAGGAPKTAVEPRLVRLTDRPSFRVGGWYTAGGRWVKAQASRRGAAPGGGAAGGGGAPQGRGTGGASAGGGFASLGKGAGGKGAGGGRGGGMGGRGSIPAPVTAPPSEPKGPNDADHWAKRTRTRAQKHAELLGAAGTTTPPDYERAFTYAVKRIGTAFPGRSICYACVHFLVCDARDVDAACCMAGATPRGCRKPRYASHPLAPCSSGPLVCAAITRGSLLGAFSGLPALDVRGALSRVPVFAEPIVGASAAAPALGSAANPLTTALTERGIGEQPEASAHAPDLFAPAPAPLATPTAAALPATAPVAEAPAAAPVAVAPSPPAGPTLEEVRLALADAGVSEDDVEAAAVAHLSALGCAAEHKVDLLSAVAAKAAFSVLTSKVRGNAPPPADAVGRATIAERAAAFVAACFPRYRRSVPTGTPPTAALSAAVMALRVDSFNALTSLRLQVVSDLTPSQEGATPSRTPLWADEDMGGGSMESLVLRPGSVKRSHEEITDDDLLSFDADEASAADASAEEMAATEEVVAAMMAGENW